MRTLIAPFVFLLVGVGCDGAPTASQPAHHAAAGTVAAPLDPVSGHCPAGRRFGFMFWGHAKGPEAERAMKARFRQDLPSAVVWSVDQDTVTVVVPDESAGEGLIKEARDHHWKVARVDWVGISDDCKLTWMNHGESLPPASAEVGDAGDVPGDAGPGATSDAGPGPDAELRARADVCRASLEKSMDPYSKAVSHQTSIASTRMLLQVFSKACKESFPDLAKAADHASHVGRKERSKTLAMVASTACPSALAADAASDVLAACPPVDGDASLPVWQHLDAGTYAFCQMLRKAGMKSTFVEELILQASLHPELDK